MAQGEASVLDVPVERVMTREARTIEAGSALSDAAEAMLQGGFRHLPVIDGEGRLVGILSERDLRTRLWDAVENLPAATLDTLAAPVSSAMTPDPLSVGPRARLGEAIEIFADDRVGALPVIDEDDRLLGILSYVDVLVFLGRRQEGVSQAAGGAPPEHRAEVARPAPRRGKKAPRRVVRTKARKRPGKLSKARRSAPRRRR